MVKDTNREKIPRLPRVNFLVAKDGQFYYTISSGNGEVIVTSETFTTRSSRLKSALNLFDLIRLNQLFTIVQENGKKRLYRPNWKIKEKEI